MSETMQRLRTGISTFTHRAFGFGGIRDKNIREAAAEARRRTDDAIATPLVNGHPIEASKNFMSAHPGRSAIALLALGAIGLNPAKESGVLGDFADMGKRIANTLTPERFEPANYCHSGGGLLGIVNFDYKGDMNSAPGDCDYEHTLQKRAASTTTGTVEQPTAVPGATVNVPTEAPAAPSVTEVPSDAAPVMHETVTAPQGAGGLALARICLGLEVDAPYSAAIVNQWEAMQAKNAEQLADGTIMQGEVFAC